MAYHVSARDMKIQKHARLLVIQSSLALGSRGTRQQYNIMVKCGMVVVNTYAIKTRVLEFVKEEAVRLGMVKWLLSARQTNVLIVIKLLRLP